MKQPLNFVALKLIAIKNALSSDEEAVVEKAYRHYSRAYSTPLHQVKELLTPHEVVLIFFEDGLNGLHEDELLEKRSELIEENVPVLTPVEESDEADDDAWVAEQSNLLKEQEKKEKTRTIVEKPKEVRVDQKELNKQVKKIYDALGRSINTDVEEIKEETIEFRNEN